MSSSVPTTETAACWVVGTRNGRFAYTTNTGSGSVTGYAVGNDGSLSPIDEVIGLPTGAVGLAAR